MNRHLYDEEALMKDYPLAAEGREPQESLRVPRYSIFKVLVGGRFPLKAAPQIAR